MDTRMLLCKILLTLLPLGQIALLTQPPALAQIPPSVAIELDADKSLEAGQQAFQNGEMHIAFDRFQQSYNLYRRIYNTPGESIALENLIQVSLVWKDYESAASYNKQLLILKQGTLDRPGIAAVLEKFGTIYQAWPRYQAAISYYRDSLDIRRELLDRAGEARLLQHLGDIYQILGNFPKALDYQQQSLTLRTDLNDSQGISASLQSLGNLYQAMGQEKPAIEHYEQSAALAQKLGDLASYGKALGSLGRMYQSTQHQSTQHQSTQPQKAIDYHQKSLAIARQINSPTDEAAALSNLGNAYDAIGNSAKAIEFQRQSVTQYFHLNDRQGHGIAAHRLGLHYLKANNLTEAETYLRHAISDWESLRTGLSDTNTIALAETQASTYQQLQTVLVRQNRAVQALEIAERGRARAFAELLNYRSRFAPGENVFASDYEPALTPTLRQIVITAQEQNATMVQYSLVSNQELYIWVVKPDGHLIFQSVDLARFNLPIAKLVQTSRRSIGVRSAFPSTNPAEPSPKRINPDEQLRQLHQLLIEPISKHLPTDPNQRVVFIPQSSLFLVPFPALKDDQGKYLIEKHTISTAPSIQTLAYTHQNRARQNLTKRHNPNPLIVGNPTMANIEDLELPALPHAEQEAKTIAQYLGTQALIGSQAKKSTILDRLPTASIVHFATHGLFDQRSDGVPGAIVFAPTEKDNKQDNGFLTTQEILNLKLTANLVVLSACDTGRGKVSGDGVLGLSRSFLAAGTPSVMVSLWAVGDQSTAFLMGEFYRHYNTSSAQPTNKAQALRQAMLTTMQKYPDPIDWAAFTLIGEAQ